MPHFKELAAYMLRTLDPCVARSVASDIAKQLAVASFVGAVVYLPGIGDHNNLHRSIALTFAAAVCFLASVRFKGGM